MGQEVAALHPPLSEIPALNGLISLSSGHPDICLIYACSASGIITKCLLIHQEYVRLKPSCSTLFSVQMGHMGYNAYGDILG